METGNPRWEIGQPMKEVYELDVYQLSEELSDKIWYAFDEWPQKIQRTFDYQIIRLSDSIAANLAEGYGRYTPPERKLFCRYARGLFEETKTWLRKLICRKIIKEEILEYTEIIDNL